MNAHPVIRFSTHVDVIACDHGLLILYDNHRPTNSATIAGNMNRMMMMVYVDPDKLAKFPSSAKFPESLHKTSRCLCKADDCAIYVDNKCIWTVDLGPS